MRLVKHEDEILPEDKSDALRLINRLKVGDRVFGNPGEGLKQTLKKLEDAQTDNVKNKDVLDYLDNDSEYRKQCALLKAGISGEEQLAEYFEKIIKHDKILQDIILFASLSDPQQNSGGDEYISDSDFLLVYGTHILILDAKNISTNPEFPIYLDGNTLVTVGGKEIMEFHPSTFIWKNIFISNNVFYSSLSGCVIIVNKVGATVWRNKEWYPSDVKPLHISELVGFLHEWVKDKDPEVHLPLLLTLSKMQIKKEKSLESCNLRNKMERFGI